MSFTYNFPVSQVNTPKGVHLGDVFMPGNSAHPNRKITFTIPIGFQFIGEDTTATEKTFTVTVNRGNFAVYRNNSTGMYAALSAATRSSDVITKTFVKSASSGPFSLNCYFFNITRSWTPPTSGSDWTYNLYTPFTFTITSTEPLTVSELPGCYPNVIIGTTVATSSFSSNITYGSGSSDTPGYVPYSLTTDLQYNDVWDGSSGTGYTPSAPINWTGLQECDTIYSNNQYVAKNMSFKNTVGDNILQWLNTDISLANVIGSISSSIATNSMNFVTSLAKGFNFNGPITAPSIVTNDISLNGILSTSKVVTNDISSNGEELTFVGGWGKVSKNGTFSGKGFEDNTGVNKLDNTGVTCGNLTVTNALTIQPSLGILMARASCRITCNSSQVYSLPYRNNFIMIPGSGVYIEKVSKGKLRLLITNTTGLNHLNFMVMCTGIFTNNTIDSPAMEATAVNKFQYMSSGVIVGYMFTLMLSKVWNPIELPTDGHVDLVVFW